MYPFGFSEPSKIYFGSGMIFKFTFIFLMVIALIGNEIIDRKIIELRKSFFTLKKH